jgi:hypothetical protein
MYILFQISKSFLFFLSISFIFGLIKLWFGENSYSDENNQEKFLFLHKSTLKEELFIYVKYFSHFFSTIRSLYFISKNQSRLIKSPVFQSSLFLLNIFIIMSSFIVCFSLSISKISFTSSIIKLSQNV